MAGYMYVVNLDHAVLTLSFEANIDIRNIVRYKDMMKEYGLGPNGAILTSLKALHASNGKLPEDGKKKKMVSFGEAALGLPSTGSYPSKTTGHSASPGKSKEKSSENSTNHVEPGRGISRVLLANLMASNSGVFFSVQVTLQI
ncbi:hypothetical protein C2845_PMPSC055944 [Panicum miliaceum]|uniref:GPN-loop GTPase n=1 Tax=Panicum miliaceum TaxID=4540 RepID=A0A3L6PBJ3_PANMI|nr:hypothetical protein C2845_PMPSC055944 [Panicum miliaceum]